jgi:steroid 5-alpha reductase family enzyme/tryptophan-rich sensory protein
MLTIIHFFAISLIIQLVLFIPSFLFKTDKLTDFAYGFTFVVLSIIALIVGGVSFAKLVLFIMILFWALRLSSYLVIRIRRMKHDKRFDTLRNSFWKLGIFWFLQGISVTVISVPALFFFMIDGTFGVTSLFGLVIWILGIMIESLADIQKYLFKINPANKGKWIETGLWKYSRHPNYFGEILIWVGVYVFTLGSLSLHQSLIALISPIFISFILLFLTGIPKLEKSATEKWGNNKTYLDYKNRTSVLVPCFVNEGCTSKKTVQLILAIFIAQLAGIMGTFFTRSSVDTWYAVLSKPIFNPPGWVFGPVWIILYVLIGISIFLIWQTTPLDRKLKRNASIIFFIQLFFEFYMVHNFLWITKPFTSTFRNSVIVDIYSINNSLVS